jgi:hypothetical protein
MDTLYTSAEVARRLEISAQRGIASAARERKADLQEAVNQTVRGLRLLSECKADKERMQDLVGFLIDAANIIDAACMRDIDNAGDRAEPVDLVEATELFEKARIA